MTDNERSGYSDSDSGEESPAITPTDEQKDALVLDRNVTITAGAGTGKTTTLTHRYLEFLRSNPSATPKNIVTITFTRKAAAELETRVREEIYEELQSVEDPAEYERWRAVLDELDDGYTHTIHAFCARLLRENAVQAPVPMEFDVLDEDDAADLQQQVVIEYLDANPTDSDVELLSRLFGSRGRLVEILAGLLDARPDSEAWLEAWLDRDVGDYMDYLWNDVCELDGPTAKDFFTAPDVQAALATAQEFRDEEFAVDDGADGVSVLRDVGAIGATIEGENDERAYQVACRDLYDLLETSSGGLYSSASHHIVGTKSSWNDETQAYSDCKDALNTLLDRLAEIEDEIATTPGDLEQNSAHYVLALARVFDDIVDAYEAEKEDREALDFPDLIETTIIFLQENQAVQASLQESFDALMVDEFQDTDSRQWELVALLAKLADDDLETDNVFLVGDKKQSIYGFRGAEVTTFETAKEALREQNQSLGRDSIPDSDQEAPTDLELSGNFRTLDNPLTFLNELFTEVFQPLDDGYADYEAEPQELSFEREQIEPVANLEGSVEYLVVPEDQDSAEKALDTDHPVTDAATEHAIAAEAEALGARLSHLLADPPQVYDTEDEELSTASPDDIAILLRRRTHLDRYQRALESYDVPYSVISGTGFYNTPEVQTLINLLRVLADPTDEISLYGVLRSPLFGFPDNRLAPLAATDDPLWQSLQTTDDQQLADAASLLTQWRELAGCVHSAETDVLPWNRVLTRVIDDTGYLVSIGADEGGQQAVANVEKFRDEIRDWSQDGTQTAANMLRRIDRQAELDPREGDAEVPEGTDGVRIMTIHSAKGLEFPIVAVPDLGSDLNFGRSIDDYGYVRLVTDHDDDPFLVAGGPSPTDAFEVEKTTAHNYADSIELPRERAEAKRLLYVACTRARDHLLLCGTHELESTEEGLGFADVNDHDEAKTWRDWVQPILLDRDSVVKPLFTDGSVQIQLKDATYTVSLPVDGDALQSADDAAGTSEPFPRIEIEDRPDTEAQRRVSATQLVHAASDYSEQEADKDSRQETDSDETETDDDGTLARNDFGTIVHRILEFDKPRSEWAELARRIAAINGFEITDETVQEVIEHTADAQTFLNTQAAQYETEETYAELPVTVDVGIFQIVGEIDHLRVTSDEFTITDYKTNRLGKRTPESLAEHYRPQMMSYALALLEHDPDRDVIVNLRFTEGSTTESFRWGSTDYDSIVSELTEIGNRIE
ncbi:UvrD-helicase domain-containing protein [Halovenus rubra]|uniref:DNA 3'-5' helicase n=2 Tax=Halovenus rubra TaxID=869890 RepID=A0ABD5X6L6_9EURY|nr:UvrD-helicase domain-containing protein [Halovenus rubra]